MEEVYYDNSLCCFRKIQATFTHRMVRVSSTKLFEDVQTDFAQVKSLYQTFVSTNVLFGRVRTIGIGLFLTMMEGSRKQRMRLRLSQVD
ncbi:hypothetical protein M0802_000760 [Mischocyttarus mexicanus]|nr:hypothetical protein M0802_000760 [Mischocyttarus mexicanus]